MQNKSMRAEGSRPDSIKSKRTKNEVPGGTRSTGTEPSSPH